MTGPNYPPVPRNGIDWFRQQFENLKRDIDEVARRARQQTTAVPGTVGYGSGVSAESTRLNSLVRGAGLVGWWFSLTVSAAPAPGATLATLPVGYRPVNDISVVAASENGSAWAPVLLNIAPTGAVTVVAALAGSLGTLFVGSASFAEGG